MVFHQDEYQDPPQEMLADYDAVMAAYYRARSATGKLSDWSSATAAAIQGKKRKHMLGFLQRQGFFKR